MRYLINLLKSIGMMISSYQLGQNMKDIRKVIKFLSSKKKRKVVIELAEYDSNILVKDIRRYINRYGSGIGIIRDVELIHTDEGVMRYTKLKLYKGVSRRDILRSALLPYLQQESNDKIIDFNKYNNSKTKKVVAV